MTPTPAEIQLSQRTIELLLEPVMNVLGRLFGPSIDQFGKGLGDKVGMWSDQVAARRAMNRILYWKRTGEMLMESGRDLQPVSHKFLLAATEGASAEDDEYLREKWAALTANEAIGGNIPPSYISVLKDLTPNEARLLQSFYEYVLTQTRGVDLEIDPHSASWFELDKLVPADQPLPFASALAPAAAG